MSPLLKKVKTTTKRRAESEQAWRDAIAWAHVCGESLRSIAEVAGVSHARVHQIVQQEKNW